MIFGRFRVLQNLKKIISDDIALQYRASLVFCRYSYVITHLNSADRVSEVSTQCFYSETHNAKFKHYIITVGSIPIFPEFAPDSLQSRRSCNLSLLLLRLLLLFVHRLQHACVDCK